LRSINFCAINKVKMNSYKADGRKIKDYYKIEKEIGRYTFLLH
jgi:hypothetical protein